MKTDIELSGSRRTIFGMLAGVLLAGTVVIAPVTARVASAAGVAELGNKVVDKSTAAPGDTLIYSINYSCPSTGQGDTCEGATFSDPLPNLLDVYGNTIEPVFVSSGFPSLPGTGGHWNGASVQLVADPAEPATPSFPGGGHLIVATADADYVAGASGIITITVRLPLGTLPASAQVLTNQATISLNGVTDPSTSATTSIQAAPPNWVLSKSGPATTRMNRNVTYAITACPSPSGSALWPTYTIVDALPEGAQFVSASNAGVYNGDVVADGTDDLITWTYDASNPLPQLNGSACFSQTVTVRYPTTDASNVGDATKTDTATGTGSDGQGASQSLGPVSVTTTLVGPQVVFSESKNSNGNYFVQDGDTVTFNLGFTNDSDPVLDTVTLTDGPLPLPFTLGTINSGTWSGGVTGTVQGSVDGSAWTDIATMIGLDGTSNVTAATGLDTYRYVRWLWSGQIDGAFAATGQKVIGTVDNMVSNTPYQNCADSTATSDVNGVVTDYPTAPSPSCASVLVESAKPDPGLTKNVSPTTLYPGETANYVITVSNNPDATGDLVDPIVYDCLPTKLIFQPGSVSGTNWALDALYNGPVCFGTGLEFHYTGTLTPGDSSAVSYQALATPFGALGIIPPGNYTNTAQVRTSAGGTFDHCYGQCVQSATVTVPAVATLNSQKLVKGDFDTGFGVLGQTQPGGTMTWQLNVKNEGNVAGENVNFIDVFPYIGDTGVIRTDQNRLTEYRPYLVTPIIAPVGWKVEYSTSDNPCRGEVGGPTGGGCDTVTWTTDDSLFVLPTYQSIKLTYIGVPPISATSDDIAMGQAFSFQWETRAPVYAPAYDKNGSSSTNPYEYLNSCNATSPITDGSHCPSAVNSFAYGVDAVLQPGVPNPGRLTSEPPRVEVRVSAPVQSNSLGDRVWFDDDYDGVQDAGETGVPYVYVELYKKDPVLGTFDYYGYTFTDDNGDYLFPTNDSLTDGLPDGDYKVRFYLPSDEWKVSPPNSTGAANDENQTNPLDVTDSDAIGSVVGPYSPPVGINGIGGYYETGSIALGGAGVEIDLMWDAGLWKAVASIDVAKVTKDTAWPDTAAGDGVNILPGRPLTWIYTVTNNGNSRLENVQLDDDGGPDPGFSVTSCSIVDDGGNSAVPRLSSSAVPGAVALNRGAVMRCTAVGTAGSVNYANEAAVIGTPVLDSGSPIVDVLPVTDTDPSSYNSIKYDLALAKTVDTSTALATGVVTYSIIVKNEGGVASQAFEITDLLPEGMSYVAGSGSIAATSVTATTVVWSGLSSLAPGSVLTLTFRARIDDFLKKPFRNFAEISADGSANAVTGGVNTPTSDVDSTPDPSADITNDNTNYGPVGTPNTNADNATITEAGSSAKPDPGDDPADGQDDADIADFDVTVNYDLALAKVVVVNPIVNPGKAGWTVRVFNDGNVPSRQVTIIDQIPTGMAFDAATSNPGCADNGDTTVTCTIANIAPGAHVDITIGMTITDWRSGPWRNWAEIGTDSATFYGESAPGVPVVDSDSTPESIQGNGIGKDATPPPTEGYVGVPQLTDPYVPAGGDEDDNDDAEIGSLVSIGDYVWLDVNRDGQQGVPLVEPPIGGVVVNLYAANGTTLLKTTTTDANGYYAFTDLLPTTNYVVEFVRPTSYGFTTQFTGALATDSNANVVTGRANVVTPAAGLNSAAPASADVATIDAGMVTLDLTLEKQLDTAPNYYPGKTLTYTLTPRNLGPAGALALWRVTEVLPSELTLVSMVGTGSPSIYTCVSVVCTSSAPLAAGAQAETIIVTVTINANYAGDAHNVAYISPAPSEAPETNPLGAPPNTSTDTSGTLTNNDAQASLTSDIYDLALAKTNSVTGSGETTVIGYTITVANQGTVASGGYTVVDTVPAGLVVNVASISDGGVYTAGTITWTLSGLTVGATRNVTWSATIGDFTKRPYRNVAEIASDSGAPWGGDNDSSPDDQTGNDGNYDTPGVDNTSISGAGVGADPEDDADIADASVVLVYDLALAKVVSAATINPNGTATYTITIDNQGDVNSGHYTITDTLPAGVQAVSASDGGVIAPASVTWSLTGLAPGAARSITVVVNITDVSKRPFKNIAEVSADGADEYDTLDVSGAVLLDVEDIDSAPNSTTTDDNNSTGTGADGYGTLEHPTNDIRTIGDPEGGQDDADVAFFDAPVVYDLALVKTGPPSIEGDGSATFTIQIKNQGNVQSGNFSVVDFVPAGLQAISASNAGVISGQTVRWGLTGLAAGSTTSVTVVVRVADFATRPWVNVAEISSDGADGFDSTGYETPAAGDVEDDDSLPDVNPDNDTLIDQTLLPADQKNDRNVDEDDHDVAPIKVVIDYDLALVKVLPTGQTFTKGGPAVFNIVVKNQGNVSSGVVTVRDVLPAGLVFKSASDGGVNAGQVVTWTIINLLPNEVKTFTLTVTIDDPKLGPFTNMAEITGDGASKYSRPGEPIKDSDSSPDSDMTNDNLVETDDVGIDQVTGDEDDHDRALIDVKEVPVLPPDLMITKTVGATTVAVGANVDFTLTVTNKGAGPAVAAVAVDTLPLGMEPVSLPGSMSYDAATRELTWAIGDLAPGAVASVTYTVKITATSGRLVNVVVVDSDSSDARPADNSATQPVDVSAGSAVLPNTGSNVESNLELAAAMVATGAFGLLLVRRRRRTTT